MARLAPLRADIQAVERRHWDRLREEVRRWRSDAAQSVQRAVLETRDEGGQGARAGVGELGRDEAEALMARGLSRRG